MITSFLRKLRRSPLEFPVEGGETVADIVFAPLDAKGVEPVVIDLGARNGMMLLPESYASRARLIGFEPNPAEYAKLLAGDTDSRKAGGFLPPFKRQEYHPYAVWRSRARRPLYITIGPGACTLMGETIPAVTERMYLDAANATRSKSYLEVHTKVLRTEEVDCVPLDEVIDKAIAVDFLKLDVEGAEVACLEGARGLLESHRVLFIKSEFVTIPYYRDHGLLGAQHELLNKCGYRLISIDLDHVTYRRSVRDLPEHADRRLTYAGDAFYMLDPERISMTPETKQRLAAIALVFGFASLALSLMEEAGLTPGADIERIDRAIRRTVTIPRMRRVWNSLPARIFDLVRR